MTAPHQASITDDLELLLRVLPPEIRRAVEAQPAADPLLEVVLDLGRRPEARYPGRVVDLLDEPTTPEQLRHVIAGVGRFGGDNRAGIERTLHRISALRNRQGDIVGLTCRVGRAVVGTVDIVRDTIEAGRSVLLLGRPGVGKTTLLREAARVLADELGKRVIVVDTSNEIAGDGDIPHPGIGRARRMQVPSPAEQHAVMIEAVENHMPEVIVIDEIGTQAEALAARTIAERGVQLIATAHGNSLENLLTNPTLNELVGGIQAVTLSDEEARRRGTQKTVLERKAPPTFDVMIEIQDKDRLAVHASVVDVVDAFLRGVPPRPELRLRNARGEVEIRAPEAGPEPEAAAVAAAAKRWPAPWRGGVPATPGGHRTIRILPYAVSRSRLGKAIRDLGAPVQVVHRIEEADLVLTLKSQERRAPGRSRDPEERAKPLFVVKSNTVGQLESFLRGLLDGEDLNVGRKSALAEAEEAAQRAREERRPIELAPQTSFLRRLQHLAIERHGLASGSRGEEPYRRVVVFPG